ncbi:MAG: hypothetical protein KC609_24090 [Myxococcales bacterium]|nr:hypothetical protein [Myxococcales bacterium]
MKHSLSWYRTRISHHNRPASRLGTATVGALVLLMVALAISPSACGRERTSDTRWALVPLYRDSGSPGIYRAIAPAADGELWVVGEARGARGDTDAVVARFDREGRPRFRRTFGADDDDRLLALCATPEGELVAVGVTEYRGPGLRDGWVLRFDRRGELLWERVVGGPQNDTLNSCAVAADGSVVAVGTRGDSRDRPQAWVVRLSTDGESLGEWTQSDHPGSAALTLLVDRGRAWVGGHQSPEAGRTEGVLWRLSLVDGRFELAETFRLAPNTRLVRLRLVAPGRSIALFERGPQVGALSGLHLAALDLEATPPLLGETTAIDDSALVGVFDLRLVDGAAWLLAQHLDAAGVGRSIVYRVSAPGTPSELVASTDGEPLVFTSLAILSRSELQLVGVVPERLSSPVIYRLGVTSP